MKKDILIRSLEEIKDFYNLKDKAEGEIYILVDKHLRSLPKKGDGTIDGGSEAVMNNDVDALRHAYVSGVYTMEYSEWAAEFLGDLWEQNPFSYIGQSRPGEENAKNMDLWNNAVGRRYGKKSKTREELFWHLMEALKKGELIIDLRDKRRYPSDADLLKKAPLKEVVVIRESETGANLLFLDTKKKLVFSRESFVAMIKGGQYPGYEIRLINEVEYPASKADGILTNNLG